MNTADWIAHATARLTAAGVDSPRLSAELLLAHISGRDRVRLATWPEREIDANQLDALEPLLQRREHGEPVAYLLRKKEFFGRDFIVNRHTLVPRPETELLVEAALAVFDRHKAVRFADLGTGSGCIALTLAAERPHWRGLAVDISAHALQVAGENAQKLGLRGVDFVRADFTCPLLADGSFDLLVSNPPYVSRAEYVHLSCEVRNFEPEGALVPLVLHAQPLPKASDGLEHARRIIELASRALRPEGVLLMEHGYTQGAALRVLLENNTWINVHNCKDIAGLDRFVQAVRA